VIGDVLRELEEKELKEKELEELRDETEGDGLRDEEPPSDVGSLEGGAPVGMRLLEVPPSDVGSLEWKVPVGVAGLEVVYLVLE
jgi:hypothetical protein